jgi:hypothetical protein
MILRGGDRRRQATQAELFEARQKALLLLAAKHPEHEFGGRGRSAPRHHGKDQAGEIGVIEIGDAAPSLPLRLLRGVLFRSHLSSQNPCLLAAIIRSAAFASHEFRGGHNADGANAPPQDEGSCCPATSEKQRDAIANACLDLRA